METKQARLDSIERYSIAILSLFFVGSLLFLKIALTAGLLLGGLIVFFNFKLLRKMVEKMMYPERGIKNSGIKWGYLVRILIVAMVIFGSLYLNFVDPLGLMIGLSTIFLAITIEALTNFFGG